MKLAVEIGRFLVTAVAVALVVPTVWLGLNAALTSGSASGSPDLFAVMALFTFVLAILGGAFLGLPLLWFLSRRGWDDGLLKTTGLGMFAGGAFVAMLLLFPSGNRIAIFVEVLPSYGALGLLAGAVAGAVWHVLHVSDRQAETL